MPAPLQAPKDFQGLRSDLPITFTRRNLPHWRQQGATYFITFHQSDALPQKALVAIKARREAFDAAHPAPHDDALLLKRSRELAAEEERWLDKGCGRCPYRAAENRELLIANFNYFDLECSAQEVTPQYVVGAWTIMPNHAHVLVRPIDESLHGLDEITNRWKSRSSSEVNRILGKKASGWFQESYDRIIRNREHLWRCLQYIGANGCKGGLSAGEYDSWVCSAWMEQGWDFEPVS